MAFAKTEALFFFKVGPAPYSEDNKEDNSKKPKHSYKFPLTIYHFSSQCRKGEGIH